MGTKQYWWIEKDFPTSCANQVGSMGKSSSTRVLTAIPELPVCECLKLSFPEASAISICQQDDVIAVIALKVCALKSHGGRLMEKPSSDKRISCSLP